MARKKATKPTSFGEVFDLGLFKEIGFPLAFPIMPLGAFVWASAPWVFDQSSVYGIQNRKITRTGSDNVTHEVATLANHLEHYCLCIEPDPCVPWNTESLRGDFVGSPRAIELFRGYQRQLACLDETMTEVRLRATKSIGAEGKLILFT
jgi:hypothetical protein